MEEETIENLTPTAGTQQYVTEDPAEECQKLQKGSTQQLPSSDVTSPPNIKDHLDVTTSLESSVAKPDLQQVRSFVVTDGKYRVKDGFLYTAEPLTNLMASRYPRMTLLNVESAWQPEEVLLDFGEPEKRPLPDFYYVSMKAEGKRKTAST